VSTKHLQENPKYNLTSLDCYKKGIDTIYTHRAIPSQGVAKDYPLHLPKKLLASFFYGPDLDHVLSLVEHGAIGRLSFEEISV
jgi:hypothetical protein